MKIANLLHDLSAKLSPAARAELQNIVKIPEFEAIRGREENREIEDRQALIARIKKIPGEHAAALAQAAKKCFATTERLESLHHETMAAREDHLAANSEALAADCVQRNALQSAEQELRRTADPRLGKSAWVIEEIDDRARNACEIVEFRQRDIWTGKGVAAYASNMGEVVAARAAIQDALARIDALKLTAVTHDEVTTQLNRIFAGLTKALAPLDLGPPVLNELGDPAWERKTAKRLPPAVGSSWAGGKLIKPAGAEK